jgi:hypothetical protein
MKRRRRFLVLALSLGLAALVLYALPRGPSGFATPADCLDAYLDAGKDGDVARYLSCLAEPLRSEKQRALNTGDLLRSMEDVKAWSRLDPMIVQEAAAEVDVDEVRTSGTCRIRFHLLRSRDGWLIVSVDAPKAVPTPIRYGTHVSEVPD